MEPPTVRRLILVSCLLVLPLGAARAQSATQALDVKYVRESEEYAALARQSYRVGTQAVENAARQVARGHWAVVLDIDETALDNSMYQLEIRAYGLPFSDATWLPFVARRSSPAVPGAVDFVNAVRRLGGHVAWITNRGPTTFEDTRANLESAGLWNADDHLCILNDSSYTKRVRRMEVASGNGRCAWSGQPMNILAFFGDQMGDFPDAGESDPDAGNDGAFGVRYFLIPDPMYGAWQNRVTRRAR